MNASDNDEILLRYLDGELSEPAAIELQATLEKDSRLQQRLNELREVHALLIAATKVQTPSLKFEESVMNNLQLPGQRVTRSRAWLLLAGSLVASITMLLLLSVGAFNNSTTILIDAPVSNTLITLPELSFNLNMRMIVNLIVFVNLILLFFLLDRTILKPYFNQRRSYHL
ncbi:MAG: hypothetical protein J0L66_16760 [Cytophagales bacterium]|nr:hypothetical protein [Cytophagales bacterium]